MPMTARRPAGAASYEALLEAASPVPDAMRGADDLAGIFYTGGTTGRSKGVMLSHGNLMADAFNVLAEGLFPGDSIYLHAAPMFHLANGAAMYALMLSGGTNVVIRAFSPEGRDAGDRALPGERDPAGADDDPDAGRSSGDRRARSVVAAAHRVRRLADERGAARPRGGRVAADRSSCRPTA